MLFRNDFENHNYHRITETTKTVTINKFLNENNKRDLKKLKQN